MSEITRNQAIQIVEDIRTAISAGSVTNTMEAQVLEYCVSVLGRRIEETGQSGYIENLPDVVAFLAGFSSPTTLKALLEGITNAVEVINANIGNGYVYAGIATPSGTPVSGKVFYLAKQAGQYAKFGGLTVTEGVNILKRNGSTWTQEQLLSMADIRKNPLIGYYECDTAGDTAAKTVTAAGYVLPATGGSVKIKMANRNTVANATLNINSTGAKPLYYNGQRAGVGNTWDTNEIIEVFYDGAKYQAYNVAGCNGDGVFDISAYNLTDGQPTPYEDLAAALGPNGDNVPRSLRKGGMSIKFVQSDKKYIKYFLTKDEWSANEADWEKVNLEEEVSQLNKKVLIIKKIADSWGSGWSVGEYLFKTTDNKLYVVTSVTSGGGVSGYSEVPQVDNALYICDGFPYLWDGASLIAIDEITAIGGLLKVNGVEIGTIGPYFFNLSAYKAAKEETDVFTDIATARAAVPSEYRRIGMYLLFKTDSNNPPTWAVYQFIGPTSSDGYWNADSRWVDKSQSLSITNTNDSNQVATVTFNGVNYPIKIGDKIKFADYAYCLYKNLRTGDLLQGYYAADSGNYVDDDASSANRVCTKKLVIPFLRKIVIERLDNSLTNAIRVCLYNASGTFVDKISDTTAWNRKEIDLSSYTTAYYFTISYFGSSAITPSEMSGKLIVTCDFEETLAAEFARLDAEDAAINASIDGVKQSIVRVVKADELLQGGYLTDGNFWAANNRVASKGFYRLPAYKKVFFERLDNTITNNYRVSLYDADKEYLGFLDGASPIDVSSFSDAVFYKWTLLSSADISVEAVAGKIMCFDTLLGTPDYDSLDSKIVSIVNNGVSDAFVEEGVKVNDEALAFDCDLRFLAFSDPHSFALDKYRKYHNIQNGGVIDIILALGDYNIYAYEEREQLKRDINKVITLSGKNENAIYAVGNHEFMANFNWMWNREEFASNQPTIDNDYVFTKKEMFEMLTRHLTHRAVFNPNDPYGNYYYIDFAPQKIRLIVLNTSDIYEDDGSLQYYYDAFMMFHQEQINWFTDVALNFVDKDDRDEWSVMCSLHFPFTTAIAEILQAFKGGSSISKSWDIYRRLKYDTSEHKYLRGVYLNEAEGGKYTISVNKDFSSQGAVDVIAMFVGHNHNDETFTQSGIKVVEFVSDNGELNDMITAEVNGLNAGNYYFQTLVAHKIYNFTLESALPTAKYVQYNKYFDTANATFNEFYILNENREPLFMDSALRPANPQTGVGTQITGFTDLETTPVSNEKCSIVCINREQRKIVCFPYGTALKREIDY